MKRLGRWTVNAITVLSLVLMAVSLYLTYRGHFRRSGVTASYHVATRPADALSRERNWFVTSSGAGVFLSYMQETCYAGRYTPPRSSARWRLQSTNRYPSGLIPVLSRQAAHHRELVGGFVVCWGEQDVHEAGNDLDLPNGRRVRAKPSHSQIVGRSVTFPCWFLTGIAAILPAWRGRTMWRHRRARRLAASSLCLACSYDLTGNVSGVCPECGTAVLSADVSSRSVVIGVRAADRVRGRVSFGACSTTPPARSRR